MSIPVGPTRSPLRASAERGWMFAVALAFGATLFAAYSLGAARGYAADASLDSPMPTRTVFVDLEYLFEESKRKKEKQASLEEFIQQTDAELKALEKQRREATDKLEMLKPGSPQAQELKEQLTTLKAQLEFRSKNAEEQLQREWDAFRVQHIEEIRMLVEEYAIQNDVDLVLQKQLPKQPGMPTWKMVFWSKPELDITGPVLLLLNR